MHAYSVFPHVASSSLAHLHALERKDREMESGIVEPTYQRELYLFMMNLKNEVRQSLLCLSERKSTHVKSM